MGTIGKFVLAVVVSAIAWVFFSVIVHFFPSTQYLFENYFIAAGMLYISICMNLSIPIGIIVTIILGIILSDIWYAPVIQYIILELFIKLVLAISVFAGAGIVMNKLAEKSPEPVANPKSADGPKPAVDHVEMEEVNSSETQVNQPKLHGVRIVPRPPWRTKRIKNEITKIFDQHVDVLDSPVLTPENYEFVTTYYLIVIIGELTEQAVNSFAKSQLTLDLSMLYCGIIYYSYLEKYVEGNNYDASIISSIDKSRKTFYKLYTDNRHTDNPNFYTYALSKAIETASEGISYEVLSKDIATLICRNVIFADPAWGAVIASKLPLRRLTESDITSSVAGWELYFVVPLAHKFIDNMQKFIMVSKQTNPDDLNS